MRLSAVLICAALTWGTAHVAGQSLPSTRGAAGGAAIFNPFREWWYRAAPLPTRESDAALQLKEHLEKHPDDPEGLWWASQVPRLLDVEPRRATEMLVSAAEKRHPAAVARVGWKLIAGEGVKQDPKGGLELLQKALDMGEPEAALQMGAVMLEGTGGIPVDRVAAESHLRDALRLGTVRAHFSLARLHHDAGNEPASLDALLAGAAAGDNRCMGALAEVYRDGRLGQQPDPRLAVRWMRDAAERGNTSMQREMAKALTSGYSGLVVDLPTARMLIESAAGAEDPEAMLMLAQGCLIGKYGFAQDAAKAGKLLTALNKMNYAPGLYTLARLHLDGAVIPHNLTKEQATKDAVAMMRRAAKLRYPPALDYLAANGLTELPASQPVTQHQS